MAACYPAAQDGRDLLIGFAAVDDHGLAQFCCQCQLLPEGIFLYAGGDILPVVVQPDLADCNNTCIMPKMQQFINRCYSGLCVCKEATAVGVHPHCTCKVGVAVLTSSCLRRFPDHAHDGMRIGRGYAGNHDGSHTSLCRSVEHLCPIGVKGFLVQMGVAINQQDWQTLASLFNVQCSCPAIIMQSLYTLTTLFPTIVCALYHR